MSVAVPASGEKFTVRIYKYLSSNPSQGWANTYELQAGSATSLTEMKQAAYELSLFETGIHLEGVQFDRYVLSTFVADGEPYNPLSFVSTNLTGLTGTRTSAGQPLALEVCLHLRKEVLVGRYGKNLYRGCLTETDVQAVAGKFTLTDLTGFQTDVIDAAITASDIGDYFTDGESDIRLVLASTTTDTVRSVSDIDIAGVSVKGMENKHYNRGT